MLLITFLVALVANFLGYIPLGNINLTTVQMSVNRGMRQTLYFLITFSIVDIFCTFLLMHFAQWFAEHRNWLNVLDWMLVGVFIILGTMSFYSSDRPKQIEYRKRDSVRYGIVLGIFNPMQVPFWMILGTWLITQGWITTEGFGLEVFSLGAGVGAFFCLYLFARFALYITHKFSLSTRVINRSIGIVFYVLTLVQLVRILFF